MHSFKICPILLACLFSLSGYAQPVDLQFNLVSARTGIVDIANAGDGSGRLFLVEQAGRVFVFDDGAELPDPFLDLRGQVATAGGEQGLLSLAFAPDYVVSGHFYVWYTNTGGDTVLERYAVSPDANQADAGSGEVVLEVPQPFTNHNGGRLRFGPDGMLYLGLGDGGGAFDPQDNGQTGTTLLGKLIRIDVDPDHSTYAIPPDNPFAHTDAVLDEVWALGLRNPWRISFDAVTGDLFIADVGQNELEEVNFQPAESAGGENYGWAVMEGSACLSPGCDQTGLTLPVAEYSHDLGCSITGGEVYRGNAYPALHGVYLFADFCSGRVWGLAPEGEGWTTTQLADTAFQISTFGLGEDKSVYVSGRNSGIYLLSDGPVQAEEPFTIRSTLNDSWFHPQTPGQGFFITVFEDRAEVFLAWFTYDTERPPGNVVATLGEPGHRWLTAFGAFEGDTAVLEIELTGGGVFNNPSPGPVQSPDGIIVLEFDGCNTGRVTYDITSIGDSGVIPIERIAPDNLPACEGQ